MIRLFCLLLVLSGIAWAERPNILVILSDDQGYADVSVHADSASDVSTPNMDALARSGALLTQGYTTGHVCAPTRLGLLTGRYQQRYGTYSAGTCGSGIDPKLPLIPKYLQEQGYRTMAFGKWHMGTEPEHNPIYRGFDAFYGFMGRGAHDYFELSIAGSEASGASPIYRDAEPIDDNGYLTTRITEEAVQFIRESSKGEEPWFAYVAYNAVHAPAQAPEAKAGDSTREVLIHMLQHLDDGVGELVQALKDSGVYENTLVFYLSDNGGAMKMEADNSPLRGSKQYDYEGGVRVPFFVSWPKVIPSNMVCDVPVFSMDILPTACAAGGVNIPEDHGLDGNDIMPALLGEADRVRDYMFWNNSDGKWAVRSHEGWKLVGINGKTELFKVATDISESEDVFAQHPEKAESLKLVYSAWLDALPEPVKGSKVWTGNLKKKKKKK